MKNEIYSQSAINFPNNVIVHCVAVYIQQGKRLADFFTNFNHLTFQNLVFEKRTIKFNYTTMKIKLNFPKMNKNKV